MLKYILTLVIILAMNMSVYCCYQRTFLPNLIENSDMIVVGEISTLTQHSFVIKAKAFLKNVKNQDTVRILQFQNWECDRRYSKYEIGQEAVFFLKLNDNGEYKIMGAANEGEIVVKQNIAYIHGMRNSKLCTQNVEFLSTIKKYCLLTKSDVQEGIKLYLDHLELINKVLLDDSPGVTTFSWFSLTDLPQNDLLQIILAQKCLGLDHYH